MSAIDLKAWHERNETKKAQTFVLDLEMLQQAAVKAELLTGDPHWDTYLTMLQKTRDETEKQAEDCREKLSDPFRIDHDQMLGLKIVLAGCQSRIETLDAVMILPKEIKDKADKALEAQET